jgi:hypothetical protein
MLRNVSPHGRPVESSPEILQRDISSPMTSESSLVKFFQYAGYVVLQYAALEFAVEIPVKQLVVRVDKSP